MKFFAPPTPLVLFSNRSPDECARRLTQAFDPERRAELGERMLRLSKQYLGDVDGRRIRVKRRQPLFSRNVSILFTGELEPERRGTKISGAFDLEPSSKIMTVVAALGALFLIAAVNFPARNAFSFWIAAACALGFLVVLLGAPRILRAIALNQEGDIRDFLCETLEAGEDPSAFN
jgi:hypothetical protein